MLYLKVPEGMRFVSGNLEDGTRDHFASDDGDKIDVQAIVKKFCQHRRNHVENIDGIEVHFKNLRMTVYNNVRNNEFVKYKQQDNGNSPGIVLGFGKGHTFQVRPTESSYGQFWNEVTPLHPEREEKVLAARARQRANRRKNVAGDVPADSPSCN